MIFAIIILFVSSLLVTAALVAANGDVKLTHQNTSQKKAYYAALAGISAYKDQLQASPYYWKKCPRIPTEEYTESGGKKILNREKVIGATEEEYVARTVPSETENDKESIEERNTRCKNEKQSAIQQANGSFRIESTGIAGWEYPGAPELTCEGKKIKALACVSLIASFTHPGFLDYVYFTAYEILDPFAQNPEPTNCEHYYQYRKEHNLISECGTIEFAPGDKVNGPMHTNDGAAVCGSGGEKPTFGREGHHDKIEMNGGHYAAGGCNNEVNMLGEYIENGPTLTPPETDSELLETAGYKTTGKTILELKTGSPNTMKVITFNKEGKEEEPKTVPFPENGVVYVQNSSSGCPIKYTPFNSNYTGDTNCGNVYVRGEYSEALTIAAANDVIINGNLTTSHASSGEPTGSGVLGLIATNFVRVYHPIKTTTEVKSEAASTSPPVGKETCVSPRERTGTLTKGKKEATSVAPTTEGLTVGEEVSGTGIASGTTITEIKNSTTLVLSKEATASGTETLTFTRSAKLNKSTEVTSITTTNLKVGEEVSGTGIAAGTTIKEIKSSSSAIILSKAATVKETEKLTFYQSGMTYYSSISKCVAKSVNSGWELHPTELLYTEACPSKSNYLSKAVCEWEINSKQCPSGATNLNKEEDPRKWGALKNLEIDAAILSTHHSFIVDNYTCGEQLGELKVWGSIAQFWRGPVGTGGGSGTGYIKNYTYDERLATNTPPQFLSPSTTSWKGGRVTAAPQAFEP